MFAYSTAYLKGPFIYATAKDTGRTVGIGSWFENPDAIAEHVKTVGETDLPVGLAYGGLPFHVRTFMKAATYKTDIGRLENQYPVTFMQTRRDISEIKDESGKTHFMEVPAHIEVGPAENGRTKLDDFVENAAIISLRPYKGGDRNTFITRVQTVLNKDLAPAPAA